MRERANDVRTTARIWLWDQHDILRILQEFPCAHVLHYEDLCQNVDRELAAIHAFLGIDHGSSPGNFRGVEHHILGNAIRTRELGSIVLDEKWKLTVTASELGAIRDEALQFLAAHPNTPARQVIQHYLNAAEWPASDSK